MEFFKDVKLSERERECLEVLAGYSKQEGDCLCFRTIVEGTGLTLKEVRRSVRSLARKGLAEFHRGLFDDDGMVAGSGYCVSERGAAFISHCDLCEKRNIYEYEGKKECQEHYGKSVKEEKPKQ